MSRYVQLDAYSSPRAREEGINGAEMKEAERLISDLCLSRTFSAQQLFPGFMKER